MDYCSYGTDRWQIVCGSYIGPEKHAAELMYEEVARLVPFIPVARSHGCTPDLHSSNLIVMGTRKDNPLVAQCIPDEEIPEEGFRVKVMQSPFDAQHQVAVIAGSSPAQVLWGTAHFINTYLPLARQNEGHIPYFRSLFSGPMPEYDATRSPAFAERGIWTWGHCIYDVERFARNMALMGLNAITMWNDYPPLNLKEAVDCFHSYGIKVIFGYSWGWDEGVDISSDAELEKWKQLAVDTYAQNYDGIGGDGIYFQTFTETSQQEKNGVSIAEAAVRWTNTVGGAMLERWPDLDIQFGLHATSVRNSLDSLKSLHPSIRIIWEDCGAFPYAYLSRDTANQEQTLDFTDRILALRPGCGSGAVLKGQVCLDWNRFEHQKGPYLMGCKGRSVPIEKRSRIEDQWHDVQSYWLKNISCCHETLKHLKGAAVYALVEDALLEDACWFPTALYAQMLWTPEWSDAELLQAVAQKPRVRMA